MSTLVAHRSPLAGSWYPGRASELQQLLSSALESSVKRTGTFVRPGALAFIVPHAAPAYSGVVAASVYRHVQATGTTRVVILGFSHRRAIEGIAVPDVDRIETPLGAIRVDREFAGLLAASPPFHSVPEHTTCDHSVEIQIPFLQTCVPDATLVPLYVGHLTNQQRQTAAQALRELVDPQTILIASSDLTHYGPDFGYVPFQLNETTPDKLRELDARALTAAGSLDEAIFRSELARTGATVCGVEPIRLLLETLSGLSTETFQETLDYDTSGSMTNDYEHSVSYGAVGYFPSSAFELAPSDQAALLASARFTLDQFRRTGEREYAPQPPESPLQQRGRAFVSLHAQGELRGCVGLFEHPRALAEAVPRLALAAAYEDDRFAPVSREEELEMEIHILTPPKRIVDPRQLIVGEHGACLTSGGRCGLLLPVVATENQLSREQFLRALARKAGVPEKVYVSGDFELSVFRDQSFSDVNK